MKKSLKPDAVVRSTPETVSWGWIAADRAPVARVKSGQTIRIDTVTHQGLNTDRDPVAFFGAAGIAPGDRVAVVEDVVTSGQSVRKAVLEIEKLGCRVVKVICLVDREEGAGELLAKYHFSPIFTRSDLGLTS